MQCMFDGMQNQATLNHIMQLPETLMPSSGDASCTPDSPPSKADLKSMAKMVTPWQPPETSGSANDANK